MGRKRKIVRTPLRAGSQEWLETKREAEKRLLRGRNGRGRPEGRQFEWLRYAAATEFITDLRGMTLREMAAIPPFNEVSIDCLRQWATADKWVSRRKKFFSDIQKAAEKKIHGSLVQARVKQLRALEMIDEKLQKQIMDGKVQPRSEEGLINALVRVISFCKSLRNK